MDLMTVTNSEDGGGNVVLRFALATYAMKCGVLGGRTTIASSPPFGMSSFNIVSQSASPVSSAEVHDVTLNVISVSSAMEVETEGEWTMDDLLSALHECLQDLQTAREESVGDREEEAVRVSQLLQRFTVRPEPRQCLLKTLVDAMVACEEGEEDSLLIECVSQVMIYLCFASLTQATTESDAVVNDICEEACGALMEALAEMQEEDFQFSAGGKIVSQTLDEIQMMLRVFLLR